MVQKKKNKLNSTALAEKNLEAGKIFLEKYADQQGVVICASGLHYKVLTRGAGQIPKKSAKVICHYKGELLDGTVFDSSYKRKRPETFYINELIVGWQEAISMMSVGSIWEVCLPPNLAYGKEELTPRKGGQCTLIFQIELIAILA
ncbi:FKBP-type peptidyl-prolyl cis-trans isomerase [Sphingobacterium sp. UGAL515B_05]|uniref:FKBP-type peptidyl-prolyl cis-trans isomerase n=1 Tax=Sphingobacterium sp. UGAL515B_05 TaxID=2986767 RepID=UPI002954B058|nr:FKBP-type peptidyl-prolyl cis-trans isomerase [Sphingobacterium sp. UGAL515B_05]WON93381.1 FKBP-type peptidyl-prolyl cis-trans isomerase [Sphingobacterium sp. UGAL515B_05]